jgi:hypothetical protein
MYLNQSTTGNTEYHIFRLFSLLSESAAEDELEEPLGFVSLTSPEPLSRDPCTNMGDSYDVESQGRPEPSLTVTTCLMDKPDIDKKVKVSMS